MVNTNSLSWESTLPPVEPELPGANRPFANKLTDEFSGALNPLAVSPGPLSVNPLAEDGTKVSEPAVIGSAETVAVVRKKTAKNTATMVGLMDGMGTPGLRICAARLLVTKQQKHRLFH